MKISIDIRQQTLSVEKDGHIICSYPVSTAKNGSGEQNGSGCTPAGLHKIRIKIGHDAPPGSVFVGRRPTGEVWSPELARQHPQRDWILSRILWLAGCETGVNRGGDVDTLRRLIYIHGTADDQPMGMPLSHGCIRMRNYDVIELFDRVPVGALVDIRAGVRRHTDEAP